MRSVSPVILAIVLAGCTEKSSELVEDEGKDIPTSQFCKGRSATTGGLDCAAICGPPFDSCFMGRNNRPGNPCAELVPPETVNVQCQKYETTEELTLDPFPDRSVEGRRPERLLPPLRIEDASDLGAWFASSAHLESAAVLAFEHMIVELEAYGAPAELVAAARTAREDEIRHARVVGDLARRFGATAEEARMDPTPVRTLLEIAIENEVEGVVRETLGAALATWRAANAGDDEVRDAMLGIARDERAHAELSWRLGEWLDGRLSEDERAVVRGARLVAVDELRATFRDEPAEDVVAIAGVPNARDVQAMVAELDRRLWSEEPFSRAA